MDATRFDAVARLFARLRLSRRQALARGEAGLAAIGLAATGLTAASAEDSTPEVAPPDAAHGPTMLFLQSFQSGSIVPKEGAEGRYIVTLEHGLGQTIYFSDRPDRIVGASPTAQFLDGLGFPEENPPNAALVVETAPGETNLAVVELLNPVYDEASHTATYEAAVLADWKNSTELGFTLAPTDLAALAPSFGPAHLFIDDCPDYQLQCIGNSKTDIRGAFSTEAHDGFCYSAWDVMCIPCIPRGEIGQNSEEYWRKRCNQEFPKCYNQCSVTWA